MELAIAYAVMDAQRRDDLNREQALRGIDGDWRAFHESEEHKVAVFAGRQTGKTYNIALRALNSQYNCEIFTPHVAEITSLVEAITQLAEEREIVILGAGTGRQHGFIDFEGGRQIRIYHLRNVSRGMRGRRWVGKEIFFSEFEHSDFADIMQVMEFEIPRAIRILCAGSMNRIEDSYAKRWFRESDLHYFIDNDRVPPTRVHMPEEYRPSIARSFIEHLPPISSIL